jgi:hypothetical protein
VPEFTAQIPLITLVMEPLLLREGLAGFGRLSRSNRPSEECPSESLSHFTTFGISYQASGRSRSHTYRPWACFRMEQRITDFTCLSLHCAQELQGETGRQMVPCSVLHPLDDAFAANRIAVRAVRAKNTRALEREGPMGCPWQVLHVRIEQLFAI